PRVSTSAAELQQVDVAPFEYAIRAGVASVMSAFVAFPGWDPSGRAASFSPEILGYLRGTLNFAGLVVTDALIMAGASAAQRVPPLPSPSWMTMSADPTRWGRERCSSKRCVTRACPLHNVRQATRNASSWCTPNRAPGKDGRIWAHAPCRS